MRGRGAGTDDGRHRWTACSSPPDVSFDRLIRKGERPLDEPSNYLPGRVYIFTGDPVACCHLPRVKNSRHGLMASERPRTGSRQTFARGRFLFEPPSSFIDETRGWKRKGNNRNSKKIGSWHEFELPTEKESTLISIRFDSIRFGRGGKSFRPYVYSLCLEKLIGRFPSAQMRNSREKDRAQPSPIPRT